MEEPYEKVSSEYLNPIAERDAVDSGIIVTPDEAYPLREEHSFYCPDYDCKDKERVLKAAKSVLGNYFFRHKKGCTHDIQPETLLHKMAVRWFKEKAEYEIPEKIITPFKLHCQSVDVDSSKTECEYRRLAVLIPDVILHLTNGFKFAIEIVVTNDISPEKKKLIESFGLPVVRVNLSKFFKQNPDKCRTDVDFIKENLPNLLTNTDLKSWVLPPQYDSTNNMLKWSRIESGAGNNGCLVTILTFGLIYLIFRRNQK